MLQSVNFKIGVLLINLGTPKSYCPYHVAKYLAEFLSDPYVIDLPMPLRYALLWGWIIPTRTLKSSRAYKSIWQKDGSPLMINSLNLVKKLSQIAQKNHQIEFAMRYGELSISKALANFDMRELKKLVIIPLFPQYARATTNSLLHEVFRIMSTKVVIPEIKIINSFYQHPLYLNALHKQLSECLQDKVIDHFLFSYHGVPERQVAVTEKQIAVTEDHPCKKGAPCPEICTNNQYCYRAQCYQMSRALAKSLNLASWSVAFQSRLGKIPWIRPYTDEVLVDLAAKNVKNIAICCPAFVADCLETLEEIGIAAKEQWHKLGGDNLFLLPCLNDHPEWINALLHIMQE